MKAVATFVLVMAVAACATTATPQAVVNEYSAEPRPDGSIRIIVTGTAAAPRGNRRARLDLGAMLKDAASKECPTGYELTEDPVPVVRTASGKLIATMGGVAKCT